MEIVKRQEHKSDYSDLVRVLDQFVLVEQKMKKKNTKIITDAAANDKDRFDYSFIVVQKGKLCERDINLGECPVFSEYVKFNGVRVIERNEAGMVSVVIVHENDIIACDLKPE